MRAKIVKMQQNAKSPVNKETVNTLRALVTKKGEIVKVATARFYMGRSNQASVVYCCLWVYTAAGEYTSGYGTAGGYGYHKESAALQEAISSAGIELYGSPYQQDEQKKNKRCYIGGVGDAAMRDALEAITRAAGYRGKIKVIQG